MHQRQQRRQGPRHAAIARIGGRVVKRMRGAAVRTGKIDGHGNRDGITLQRRVTGRAHRRCLAAGDVDAHDRRKRLRGACDRGNVLRIDPSQVRELHIGEVEFAAGALLEIDHGQPIDAALAETHDRPPVAEQYIVRLAELPERRREFNGPRPYRACACRAIGVQIPESTAIGDEVQRAVGVPLGFEHGLGRTARHEHRRFQTGSRQFRDLQLRAVPRHVGMIPGNERQPPPVRTQARIGNEIAAVKQDLAGTGRAAGHRCGQSHQRVANVGRISVILAHAHERSR